MMTGVELIESGKKTDQEMIAIVFSEFGSRDVLKLSRVKKPEPASGEVRVRVKACALNLIDYYVRLEVDNLVPLPHILGSDIAGTVDKLGSGVEGWQVGDPVIISPSISCGKCNWCRRGEDSMCKNFKIIGYQIQGGYAEYIVVPARNLLRKPKTLTYEEAAAIPLTFMTAYRMIFTRGNLKAGEKVLVMGGSGGVGTAAIQLCKTAGAWVITTVSNAEKEEQVKNIGADYVVRHNESDWTNKVLAATGGEGVDLVIEHIGGNVTASCVDLLAHGGRLVSIGSTTGDEMKIVLSKLYHQQASIMGSYMGTYSELQQVLKMVELGMVKPIIAKTFPLEEAIEAHKFMEERRRFGKIVLTVS